MGGARLPNFDKTVWNRYIRDASSTPRVCCQLGRPVMLRLYACTKFEINEGPAIAATAPDKKDGVAPVVNGVHSRRGKEGCGSLLHAS